MAKIKKTVELLGKKILLSGGVRPIDPKAIILERIEARPTAADPNASTLHFRRAADARRYFDAAFQDGKNLQGLAGAEFTGPEHREMARALGG